MNYQINSKKKAFTLLEIIVVISIFSIFLTFSVTNYINYKERNEFDLTIVDIVESMRFAQVNAQKNKNESKWGVKISNNNLVIFKGNNFNNRDQAFDETINFSSNIQLSGQDEIIFEINSGDSLTVGTTTITNQNNSININVNEKGTITY